jgi:superfamily II DNA helicase RecQ
MLVKILTLTFNSAYGGFDDTAVQEFLKDKEAGEIKSYFFIRNEIPYLTLVIQYYPLRQELDPKLKPQGMRSEAWRQELTEMDMGLFNILRNWRSERARKEGLPPYVLFTNRQLTQLVKTRPQSLAALSAIESFGQSRVDKYGREILAITRIDLSSHQNGAPSEEL